MSVLPGIAMRKGNKQDKVAQDFWGFPPVPQDLSVRIGNGKSSGAGDWGGFHPLWAGLKGAYEMNKSCFLSSNISES